MTQSIHVDLAQYHIKAGRECGLSQVLKSAEKKKKKKNTGIGQVFCSENKKQVNKKQVSSIQFSCVQCIFRFSVNRKPLVN